MSAVGLQKVESARFVENMSKSKLAHLLLRCGHERTLPLRRGASATDFLAPGVRIRCRFCKRT